MKIYIIAGEPSGDALGAAVMQGLKELNPEVAFNGVGGPLMQAHGLSSQFDMTELSIMGLAEVLPKYRHLKRRISECAEAALAWDADILLTVDSPDFCLRVAKIVKAARPGLRTVHYVAPSVWAWRPGRAVKMAKVIDHVLALLPFEPPLMQEAGMTCDFVGHPIVADPVASPQQAAEFRKSFGIGNAPLILALPGSRKGEVSRLAPVFGAALSRLLGEHPDARIVLPAAAPVAEMVEALTADWPGQPILLAPATDGPTIAAKRAAFAAADVALAASGTVSLELAANQTPMLIAYDMNWVSRQIISRMLKIDTVTLVNLVSDTRVVPEFIGKNCQPDLIAKGLEQVLADPMAQQAAMQITMDRLGAGQEQPGLRAARAILAAV